VQIFHATTNPSVSLPTSGGIWKNGQFWVAIKTHYNQEACDAECPALARALKTALRRQTLPERVTIFTDAQAAI